MGKSVYEESGLVVSRGRMLWGHKHGRLRWAPVWLRGFICTAWNWTACLVIGHDRVLCSSPQSKPCCTYCCRPLTRTPEEEEVAQRQGWKDAGEYDAGEYDA